MAWSEVWGRGEKMQNVGNMLAFGVQSLHMEYMVKNLEILLKENVEPQSKKVPHVDTL